jgi:prophage maintenance system killer protein
MLSNLHWPSQEQPLVGKTSIRHWQTKQPHWNIINNHPFVDGNKRIGHACMEMFLLLNGFEIDAATDEQEELILSVASGKTDRQGLSDWLDSHIIEKTNI